MSSTRTQFPALATDRTPTSSLPSETWIPETENRFQPEIAVVAERPDSFPEDVLA